MKSRGGAVGCGITGFSASALAGVVTERTRHGCTLMCRCVCVCVVARHHRAVGEGEGKAPQDRSVSRKVSRVALEWAAATAVELKGEHERFRV